MQGDDGLASTSSKTEVLRPWPLCGYIADGSNWKPLSASLIPSSVKLGRAAGIQDELQAYKHRQKMT